MKTSTERIASITSFYMAFSYILGIFIFLFILDYPNIEAGKRINLLSEYHSLHYFTNLLLYVIFGFSLILFSLSVYENFKEENVLLVKTTTIIGITWAGLLIASGMVANAGIGPAIELLRKDAEDAGLFWSNVEAVSSGLGGANGEVVGGVFTILVSLSAWQINYFNKFLKYLGLMVGALGIASTFPGLNSLTGIFGITQAGWFIWLGITFLRNSKWSVKGS